MTRVLIVKPSSLGDILHAFPAVDLLRERISGLKVDWLVHPAFSGLLDYMPCVERRIPFNRGALGEVKSFLPQMRELMETLREVRYDVVIDLQGLLRSSGISFLAKSSRRVGFASPKEKLSALLYTDRIRVPKEIRHAADRNTALMSAFLGIPFERRDYSLPLNVKNMEGASNAFRDAARVAPRPLVGLIPGARWDTKRWPPVFFADLARSISGLRPEISFAIFGALRHRPRQVDSRASGPMPVSRHTADQLGELVETFPFRSLSVLGDNDSGPMAYAAASSGRPWWFFSARPTRLTGPRSASKERASCGRSSIALAA
jgi:ADP-heptose:LPS heptosyltransferase